MPLSTTWIVLAAAAVAAVAFASKKDAPAGPPTPTPDPPRPTIPGVPANVVTILALNSLPEAGPEHRGALMSNGLWKIETSAGSLVVSGSGEAALLNQWDTYTSGGTNGQIVIEGVFAGFQVRTPGCAPGFPKRWCWTTTWQPGFLHHDAATRKIAITKALARARAGA